jgi:tRNA pseudouridine13 synthase
LTLPLPLIPSPRAILYRTSNDRMRLKQSPDNFRVEERTDLVPCTAGDFALYRLDKAGWTTHDALDVVRRRWQIDWRRVAFGGLKDRHARTTQFFTIFRGPRRNLTHERIAVAYLGRVAEPFSSIHILSNVFTVVLGAVAPGERERATVALEEVVRAGLPNYFDDQRFGSAGEADSFVARELVFGRFEDALRLALTAPYEHDRAADKREKANLLQHWGDWTACRATLPRGPTRNLVEYLGRHPTDFRGAVARLRPEWQGLYLSAYQSHLWNRMLAQWLASKFPPGMLVTLRQKLAAVPAPRHIPADVGETWQSLRLPLPSARLKPDPGAEWQSIVDAVLAEEGLSLAQLKVPGLRKPFFSKGERAGCVRPAGLAWEFAPDEQHPGKEKLTLRFELPRGSYATVFVKRITAVER